jgi:hypothetical protein
LASCRFQIVLALEMEASLRSTGYAAGIRELIREMSIANPLWGAPRIHGELLKLGIDIGQTSVAKYMARRRAPPSQGGRRSFVTTLTVSPRWTFSWCRQSSFVLSMDC